MTADALNTGGGVEAQYGGINTAGKSRKRTDPLRELSEMNYGRNTVAHYDAETECNFESECKWTWQSEKGFVRKQASSVQNDLGPKVDANDNKKGYFLLLRVQPTTKEVHVMSPVFEPTEETCSFRLSIYQEFMEKGMVRIVLLLHNTNKTQVIVDQISGDQPRAWIHHDKTIGKVSQNFQIMMEVVPALNYEKGSLIAFDNIRLNKCYPEPDRIGPCVHVGEYNCNTTGTCTSKDSVCDIVQDCPSWDDEQQNCDKVPYGARCTFDTDWCGWDNEDNKTLKWMRHNGTTSDSGNPNSTNQFEMDHTYNNSIGRFMHVNAKQTKNSEFAAIATLKSVTFNPPPSVHGNLSSPYYNSCQIRFYFHQTSNVKSGIGLQITEIQPKDNVTRTLWWSYQTFQEQWVRHVVTLSNITYRYYLHFDLRKGIRYNDDIAIDDVTLSPECFGLNIPEADLQGYNYWNYLNQYPSNAEPSDSFINETYYEFTSCGASGRYGPYQQNCTESYKNTSLTVEVLKEPGLSGVQKWVVPSEGYYTIIAFGAGGGKGSGGIGSTRGSMTRAVYEFKKSEEIYVLIGQKGTSACIKSMDPNIKTSCSIGNNYAMPPQLENKMSHILAMDIRDGGGGGGGATYVFLRNRKAAPVPLMVASGGGGLGLGRFIDTGMQHGKGITDGSRKGSSYLGEPDKLGGPGGSWLPSTDQLITLKPEQTGQAFNSGSVGGRACYPSEDGRGDGGFGGGGGGCTTGGGGAGYIGGTTGIAGNTTSMDGTGGASFINTERVLEGFSEASGGFNTGSGMVFIIPGIDGCECDYRCLALDARRSETVCICPESWRLDEDGKRCLVEEIPDTVYPTWFVAILIGCLILVVLALASFCFMLYNRYQLKAAGVLRRKMLTGADLQLNRLRVASDGILTEYNPNYEFAGSTYTLKDLKDIPRDQLRLIKALGQGAFGEVYQGFYRQRSGDTVEMPVAVKTLPEMSTHQAEVDFLMEALIMSKFNHPNIVHFIGVCFDKHPRFIVLELLAGGDLKNFLRESRPKPEKGSPLSMKDLIMIAIDVAKGCKYLENNRFIHRDIAARNCLLTTKGPGRCVKIADFGMSRDIYRSDYYRKGGKAMLPIKWMPPEAFLDGIFTSKTDVWSFGVLLWEIMSMGYMPYTGCANRDVMQLVTSGGRLEPPFNCPGPVYGIMTQCWHPAPEKRPDFALILERLGYCSQDPQVMAAPLPVFYRPPSHERDATIMRPNSSDDSCIQMPQSADYLIPNHLNQPSTRHAVGSTSSVEKLIPENSDSWETSFVIPSSKSTQPLLQQESKDTEPSTGSVDKLVTVEPDEKKTTNSPQDITKSDCIAPTAPPASPIPPLKTLDAAALAKKYIPEVTSNGIIPKPYLANNVVNKFHNESEISC